MSQLEIGPGSVLGLFRGPERRWFLGRVENREEREENRKNWPIFSTNCAKFSKFSPAAPIGTAATLTIYIQYIKFPSKNFPQKRSIFLWKWPKIPKIFSGGPYRDRRHPPKKKWTVPVGDASEIRNWVRTFKSVVFNISEKLTNLKGILI